MHLSDAVSIPRRLSRAGVSANPPLANHVPAVSPSRTGQTRPFPMFPVWLTLAALLFAMAVFLAAFVTSPPVQANHEGDGAVHCAFMHSHPIDEPSHHESGGYTIPEGYEQYEGYVHCHGEDTSNPTSSPPTTNAPATTSTTTATGTGGSSGGGGGGGGNGGGPVNSAPAFSDGDLAARSVAENTPSGVHLGDPVSAEDEEDNALTYRLGSGDDDSFAIDDETGQLSTKAALDYEEEDRYRVNVIVSDGNSESDIRVVIRVTDLPLPPANAYDVNKNDVIDRSEALAAVADYYRDELTREEILFIIDVYQGS